MTLTRQNNQTIQAPNGTTFTQDVALIATDDLKDKVGCIYCNNNFYTVRQKEKSLYWQIDIASLTDMIQSD